MTKIANFTLLVSPIIFLIIMFFAAIMVGAAGHSSGDTSIETISIIIFSIIYSFLMIRKLQNKLSSVQASFHILLSLIICLISSYYSIMFLMTSIRYTYEIVISGLMGYISICSIIVTYDTYKNHLMKN